MSFLWRRSYRVVIAAGFAWALFATPVRAFGQLAAPENFSQEIEQLAAAQEAALRSEDGQEILSASEANAAQAIALSADLKVAEAQVRKACDLYEQALELVDHDPGGRFDQVLPRCISLAKTRPEADRDWMLEAREYRLLHEPEKAAEALLHAWALRGNPEVGLTAVAAYASAGERKQAEAVGEQVLQKSGNPADAQGYTMVAAALHNGGDLNGAIDELQHALALAPASASVHFALGKAYWELNEQQYNPDSLREFTEAERLNPKDVSIAFDLGLLLSQYHRYDEAEQFLRAAAALDPASPDAWLQIGLNAYAQNRTGAAEDALEKAIQLAGSDESRDNYAIRRAYTALSRLATDDGEAEKGEQLARHAEELHERVLRSLAPAAVSQSVAPDPLTEEVPGSQGATQEARARAPEPVMPPAAEWPMLERNLEALIAECLNDSGTALAQRHDYEAALPFFREAAAADPEHIPVERNLGLAAVHTGHWKEAQAALTKALQQMPGDALTLRYLEQVRQHQS